MKSLGSDWSGIHGRSTTSRTLREDLAGMGTKMHWATVQCCCANIIYMEGPSEGSINCDLIAEVSPKCDVQSPTVCLGKMKENLKGHLANA